MSRANESTESLLFPAERSEAAFLIHIFQAVVVERSETTRRRKRWETVFVEPIVFDGQVIADAD